MKTLHQSAPQIALTILLTIRLLQSALPQNLPDTNGFCNAMKFQAGRDGQSADTRAIQSAVDACDTPAPARSNE